jgi:hypothetical protein
MTFVIQMIGGSTSSTLMTRDRIGFGRNRFRQTRPPQDRNSRTIHALLGVSIETMVYKQKASAVDIVHIRRRSCPLLTPNPHR